jgi:hypothetical protein
VTTQEQASGAGFTEDGVEFWPLNALSRDKINVWMQDGLRKKTLSDVREMGLRGDLAVGWMVAGVREALRLTLGTPEGYATANSYAGLLKVLDVSSRGKFKVAELAAKTESDPDNPDSTLEDAVQDLAYRVFALTDPPPKDEADGDEPDKTEPDPTPAP